jgi:hypothetical protein
MFELLWSKTSYYLSTIGQYSILSQPIQVILSICPSIFRFIDERGKLLFLAILLLSVVHYRLFLVFFPLVLLNAKLPDYSDKKFWTTVMMFSLVLVLWGYMQFTNLATFYSEWRGF